MNKNRDLNRQRNHIRRRGKRRGQHGRRFGGSVYFAAAVLHHVYRHIHRRYAVEAVIGIRRGGVVFALIRQLHFNRMAVRVRLHARAAVFAGKIFNNGGIFQPPRNFRLCAAIVFQINLIDSDHRLGILLRPAVHFGKYFCLMLAQR